MQIHTFLFWKKKLEKKLKNPKKSTFSDFFNFSNYFTIKHISVKKSCFWTTPSIPESRDNNECSVWSSIFPCFSSWKDKYLCSNYPDLPWDFLKVRIIYKKVWRKFKISLKLSNFSCSKFFPVTSRKSVSIWQKGPKFSRTNTGKTLSR